MKLSNMAVRFNCNLKTPVLRGICDEAPKRKHILTIDLSTVIGFDDGNFFQDHGIVMIFSRASLLLMVFQCAATGPSSFPEIDH